MFSMIIFLGMINFLQIILIVVVVLLLLGEKYVNCERAAVNKRV